MGLRRRWPSLYRVGETFTKTKPYASGGAYINFLTQDEAERTESAYGPTFARLQEVKKKFDPNNLFRMNQNIKPEWVTRYSVLRYVVSVW